MTGSAEEDGEAAIKRGRAKGGVVAVAGVSQANARKKQALACVKKNENRSRMSATRGNNLP